MKKETHPKYYVESKIMCACGNVFYIGSTKKEMETEVCYKCHPFYTGEEKLLDTAGRVEKFKIKIEKASKIRTAPKRIKRATKKGKKEGKKLTIGKKNLMEKASAKKENKK